MINKVIQNKSNPRVIIQKANKFKDNVNIIDLFAGVGGFHNGILASYSLIKKNVSARIVSEIEPTCIEVYKKNFKEEVHGDINAIKIKDFSKFTVDILTAGFPCQPFSNSGKKLGLSDPRGQFYFKIEEIIKYFKPKAFILENVPGIRFNGGGRFISKLSSEKCEIGSSMKFLEENLIKLKDYTIKWKELDSSDFGSPQVRKRVYITAIHKDYCKEFDFEFPKFEINPFISIVEEIKLPEYELNINQEKNIRSFMSNPPSFKDRMRRVGNAYLCKGGNVGQGYHSHGLVPTLTKVWARFLPIYFPREGEILPILEERKFNPNNYYGKGYIRKASVEEVYALQGFPLNFQPHSIKNKAYEHAGNAVNAKVVMELTNLIIKHLY
jgi:DNA (cytosine-5)-methyltransferase 1